MKSSEKRLFIFIPPVFIALGLLGMLTGLPIPFAGMLYMLLPIFSLVSIVAVFVAWKAKLWWGVALNIMATVPAAFLLVWFFANMNSMH